ncbi:MAG TPA: hypothetical protein VFJ57_07210 [Solirubrobacterales bacterium]|nr:hypothetical protein [Solirubrobacterales bacterium]
MIGRKAMVGLALLCALVFGAVSAQSAFAVGTTVATCKLNTGKGAFKDAHCSTKEAGGNYEAPEVTENAETFFEGSNSLTKAETTASTPAVLTSTVEGVATEVECSTSASTGGFKNKETEESKIMYAESQGAIKLTTITYTGCVVQKPKAAGEECTVNSKGKAAGTIVTNQLSGITGTEKIGGVEEMYVVVLGPGEVFAELTFTAVGGKTCPAALTKKALALTGEAKLEAIGATMVSPHPNPKIASTLKLGGFAATLTSSETMRMDKEGGPTQSPLFLKTT